MIVTQTKNIDGHDFTVTQLPGFRSMRMLNRLMRVLGPGLAKLAGEVQNAQRKLPKLRSVDQLLNVDVSAFGEGLTELFAKLSDDELESITRALLEGTRVKSATITKGQDIELLPVFDVVMQGRVWTSLKLLVFAVEVNYGDFFASMGLRSGALAQLVTGESAST